MREAGSGATQCCQEHGSFSLNSIRQESFTESRAFICIKIFLQWPDHAGSETWAEILLQDLFHSTSQFPLALPPQLVTFESKNQEVHNNSIDIQLMT